MSKTRNANSASSAPVLIGEPQRPGKVEGGNVDPIIVSGELEVKKMSLLRPNDIIKVVSFREDSNEAVVIADERSAFTYAEKTNIPDAYNTTLPQSKVMYYNGNTLMDVNNYSIGAGVPSYNNKFYKLNAAGWRPMFNSITNSERPNIEGLGKAGSTFGDMCLLVGQEKSNVRIYQQVLLNAGGYVAPVAGDVGLPVTDDGVEIGNLVSYDNALRVWVIDSLDAINIGSALAVTGGVGSGTVTATSSPITSSDPWGALLLLRPSLIGQFRNVDDDTSPLRRVEFTSAPPDFADVELFGVCWDKTPYPADSIDQYTLGVAYVVGTLKTSALGEYVPKAYKIVFRTGTVNELGYEDETFGAMAYDLEIENVMPDGILFGCDYDDENDILYVTGARYNDEVDSNQIFAKYADKTQLWTDLSPKLGEKSAVLVEDGGYLVQDANDIRLICSSGNFITNGVKRGNIVSVNMADYTPQGNVFPLNSYENGLFVAQKVISEREIVLDKRMSNQIVCRGNVTSHVPGLPFMMSSLFNWGFLQADINEDATDVTIDIPVEFFYNFAMASAVFNVIAGQIIYINGEQIQLGTSPAPVVALDTTGTKQYARYVFSNCIRGVNRTIPTPHSAFIDTGYRPTVVTYTTPACIRTVCVLCTSRAFKIINRLTDVKLNSTGTSVFITGDAGCLVRYDILEGVFVDYREKMALPQLDLGRMTFKPDSDSALIVANMVNQSTVYLFEKDYFRRVPVPTTGIVNDTSWYPDGMSALIGGKNIFKMTRKVNVAISEREPKENTVRYLFSEYQIDGNDDLEDTYIPGMKVAKSDALAIDDLNEATIFVKVLGGADGDHDEYEPEGEAQEYEMELRIYLSGRGDEMHRAQATTAYMGLNIRRYFWRSVDISDVASHANQFLLPPDSEGPQAPAMRGAMILWSWRAFKLPVWAKYIAVDVVSRSRYTAGDSYITIGVQGGTK